MCEITLSIPDEAMTALAASPDDAGDALRMLAAVKLFELKRLSSGAAARLAGILLARDRIESNCSQEHVSCLSCSQVVWNRASGPDAGHH